MAVGDDKCLKTAVSKPGLRCHRRPPDLPLPGDTGCPVSSCRCTGLGGESIQLYVEDPGRWIVRKCLVVSGDGVT